MRERLQQLIDTNEFEFLKTMSEEDIWKFVFAILYVFSEREERTGHWINDKNDMPICSRCGYIPQYDRAIDDYEYSNYCPSCGCRMIEP